MKIPVAVNGCCVPAAIEAVAGDTTMDVRFAATTVSVAVSVSEPTVAVIVVLPTPAVVASPVLSMVATDVDDEFQVTPLLRSWLDPSLYRAVAVYC